MTYNTMTITLIESPDTLDPNDTTPDPQASLTAYFRLAKLELQRLFPRATVETIDGATTGILSNRAWTLRYSDEPDYRQSCEDERIIQDTLETVYATGEFWQ